MREVDLDRLRAKIKEHEGLRLMPYDDSLGRITIGYGRCLETRGITMAEAEAMFETDVADAVEGAKRQVSGQTWLKMGEVRREVLSEMVFQLGTAGVSAFRRMLDALDQEDWYVASLEMTDSRWHKQTPNRAEELAKRMHEGTP